MRNQERNTVGIIAEYNPFHKGHAWQLKAAKELSGAEYCIAVISGDFVQRGAPAIYDKYARTAMALEAGVDLVLELPSIFAVSSAEDFAACGVALLDRLGTVGSICFGSECGDMEPIERAASILHAEPEAYAGVLKERLKQGFSFPQARAYALSSLERFEEGFLSSPNNILAIEYVKAMKRRNSPLRPLTLQRQGKGYHDDAIPERLRYNSGERSAMPPAPGTPCDFCSASAIRKAMEDGGGRKVPERLLGEIPDYVTAYMEQGYPIRSDDFSALLQAALLPFAKTCVSPSRPGAPRYSDITRYLDVSPELGARIEKSCLSFETFEERIASLKTRQYTYTRISRALFHILLGMTKQEAKAARAADYAPYARVLGFRRCALPLLTQIKKRSLSPLITKTADAGKALDGTAWEMVQNDFYRSHLYQAVVTGKYGIGQKNEYTRSVIIRS